MGDNDIDWSQYGDGRARRKLSRSKYVQPRKPDPPTPDEAREALLRQWGQTGADDQLLDRVELCDVLKITMADYRRMKDHRDFPSPLFANPGLWRRDDVREFKRLMQRAYFHGEEVPDCFFVQER
jgi:hypothetical protein